MAICLVRLPPLNSPIISIFSSHNIARIMFIVLFFCIFLQNKAINITKKKYLPFFLFIISLMISKTLSILTTLSIIPYLTVYKDQLIGYIIFFLVITLFKNQTQLKYLIAILMGTLMVNIVLYFTFLSKLPILYYLFSKIFYSKYWESVILHSNRNRYFLDSHEMILIPIILLFVIQSGGIKKFFYILIIIGVFLSTVFSNFRYQLLVCVFSFMTSISAFFRTKILLLVLAALFFISFVVLNSTGLFHVGSLNRILDPNTNDAETIYSRIDYWKYSVEMGLSQLVFGTGLGSFYDYFPKQTVSLNINDPYNQVAKSIMIHPHNIFFAAFSETGVTGLIIVMSTICFFLYTDLISWKQAPKTLKSLMLCFWSLFIISLLIPDVVIQYTSLYWLLRGLIVRYANYDTSALPHIIHPTIIEIKNPTR